ncbi:hypothetical protein [Acidovorax lacteus]|uniref:Mor transcription activator domain-containing protein n=1 Tax=Acidovorax lacteus TaxID=1924988 RepID=A0ABP8L0T5_9BURK
MSLEPQTTSPHRMSTIVERVAAHPAIEQAVISAIRAQLPAVIEAVTRDLYGGQMVRMYVGKGADARRTMRNERILQLASLGYAHKVIGSQVGCSERTVFRVIADAQKAQRVNPEKLTQVDEGCQ